MSILNSSSKQTIHRIVISIIIILYSTISYTQTALDFDYIYLSPEPMSKNISLHNNIAIRVGEKLDPGLIKTVDIRVNGSKSGMINGQIKLSDDHYTLIFKPLIEYQTNELISVKIMGGIQTITGKNISNIDFYFQTTSISSDKYKALHKTIYRDILLDYNNHLYQKEERQGSGKKFVRGDSLPETYPEMLITMNTNPSPGYFFISPNEGGAWEKFMIIMDNYGTPVYYKSLQWGVLNMG